MGKFKCFGMLGFKKPRVIGSPGLYLKSCQNNSQRELSYAMDSKCNFERKEEGVELYFNFMNRSSTLFVPYCAISEIIITQGREDVRLRRRSVMSLLLQLGVSLRHARYFNSRPLEYSIDSMELLFTSSDYEFKFEANGYLFEEQCDFFKRLQLHDRLMVVRNSSYVPKG